jgi:hypothetical protein
VPVWDSLVASDGRCRPACENGIIDADASTKEENIMDDQGKADLERLETLREKALFAPEAEREAARLAYEKLRAALFNHQGCESPGEHQETGRLKSNE